MVLTGSRVRLVSEVSMHLARGKGRRIGKSHELRDQQSQLLAGGVPPLAHTTHTSSSKRCSSSANNWPSLNCGSATSNLTFGASQEKVLSRFPFILCRAHVCKGSACTFCHKVVLTS
jgi:hypothetical protein